MYLHGCCNLPLDSELLTSVTKEIASGLRVPFSGMMQGEGEYISYYIQPPFTKGRTLAIFGELLQVLLQICARSCWLYVNIIRVHNFYYWYWSWSGDMQKALIHTTASIVMRLQKFTGGILREVTGEWRRLHNEELNDLYSSPNIVRVMKSRRMRWAGHVARMGEERGRIGSWWGNRRERDH